MKITEVKLLVLEDPSSKGRGGHSIAQVEGLRRIQYTHQGRPNQELRPARQSFLEVHTDEGIVGRSDTSMTPYQADIVRYHAVGRSPWEREGLFQQFWKGTRWVYQPRGGLGRLTTVCGTFWARSQACRFMRWWGACGRVCPRI